MGVGRTAQPLEQLVGAASPAVLRENPEGFSCFTHCTAASIHDSTLTRSTAVRHGVIVVALPQLIEHTSRTHPYR